MLIFFKLQGFGNTSPAEILKLRTEIKNRISEQTSTAQKTNDLFNLLSSYQSVKQKELRNVNKTEYYANQLTNLQLNEVQKNRLADFCIIISLNYLWGMNGVKKHIFPLLYRPFIYLWLRN